jgi:hypothetical protein
MQDVYGGFEPEKTVDHELGITLPANVEAEAKRLIAEIKRFDTFVDSEKTKAPQNLYMGWKLWAKGTIDALVAVLMKDAVRSGVIVFPLWPVGGVMKALTVEADKALDDTFIGGLFVQLSTWVETFRANGMILPGPMPTAGPGFKPPGSDGILSTITKGALIVGGVGLGLILVSKLLESRGRAPQTQTQEA